MTELIKKLPHGNIWWEFTNYDIIQSVDVSQKRETEVIKEEQIPITTISKKEKKKFNKKSLFDAIVENIDDLYPLYTENMQRDAKIILKNELKKFINEASFQKLFIGPKLRTLLSWLNGNKIEKQSLYLITQFVNWFTSIEIINEDKNELRYIDKSNELYIVDK